MIKIILNKFSGKVKISVTIITMNRKEDLKRSLDSFLNQEYEDKEIIVIDNASDDGTSQMIAEEYSEIKYLYLAENIDTKALNIAVDLADGDIIYRTDDDSNPEDKFLFSKIADIFQNNSDIDIIAMEDIEVKRGYEIWNWYPYEVDKENVPAGGYKSHTFLGGGAAIRKEVFNKIGGFWEFGFEELDFSSRAILAGFTIRYFPNLRFLHYASPSGRVTASRWIKMSKQYFRYQMKFFPFAVSIGRASQIMIYQIMIAFASRIPIRYILEGVLSMLAAGMSALNNERTVAPKEKIKDITLGVSLFKAQMNYFKSVLKNKLKKK